MKLTIDLESKIVELSGAVTLEELIKGLKEVAPKEWKKFYIRSTMDYPVLKENWWDDPMDIYISDGSGEFLYR